MSKDFNPRSFRAQPRQRAKETLGDLDSIARGGASPRVRLRRPGGPRRRVPPTMRRRVPQHPQVNQHRVIYAPNIPLRRRSQRRPRSTITRRGPGTGTHYGQESYNKTIQTRRTMNELPLLYLPSRLAARPGEDRLRGVPSRKYSLGFSVRQTGRRRASRLRRLQARPGRRYELPRPPSGQAAR